MVFSLCCRSLIFQRPPPKNEVLTQWKHKLMQKESSYCTDFWEFKWHFLENWSVLLYLLISYLEHNSLCKQRKLVTMVIGPSKRWNTENTQIQLLGWACELPDRALHWPNLLSWIRGEAKTLTWSSNVYISRLIFPPNLCKFLMSQKQQPCATKWTRTLFFLSVGKCCRSDTPDQRWQPWRIYGG